VYFSDREANRLYGTVTFMPTPTTTIRVNVEQRIGQNFYLEGTFARRLTHNVNDYSSGVDDNLYLDKNPTYFSWDGKVVANRRGNFDSGTGRTMEHGQTYAGGTLPAHDSCQGQSVVGMRSFRIRVLSLAIEQ
jgi:hypothetical protein